MLTTKTKELVEGTKEVLDFCISKSMNIGSLKYMGHDELNMMQKAVNLMDLMEDYAMEEAKTLDEINEKLDKLLNKKD